MNSNQAERDAIVRQFIQSVVEDVLRSREGSILEAVKAEIRGFQEDIASGIRGAIKDMVTEEVQMVARARTSEDAETRAVLAAEVEQIKAQLAFMKGKEGEITETRGAMEGVAAAMNLIGNRLDTIEQRLQTMTDQYLQTRLEKRLKTIETVLDGILATPMGKRFIAENYVFDTKRYQEVVTTQRAEWYRLSEEWKLNSERQQKQQEEMRDEHTRRRNHNILLRDLAEVERDYAKADIKDAWRRSEEAQVMGGVGGGWSRTHDDPRSRVEMSEISGDVERKRLEESARENSRIAEENLRRAKEKKRMEEREKQRKGAAQKEREAAKKKREAAEREREAAQRERETAQREREAQRQREEAQRQREEAQRYNEAESYAERMLKEAVEAYWREYEKQSQGPDVPLTFASIRWPMLQAPKNPHDIHDMEEAIADFLLSPYHSTGISGRKRLNLALLRWHPDKWYGIHQRIVPEDRERVEEGVTAVVICLRSIQERIRAREG